MEEGPEREDEEDEDDPQRGPEPAPGVPGKVVVVDGVRGRGQGHGAIDARRRSRQPVQ